MTSDLNKVKKDVKMQQSIVKIQHHILMGKNVSLFKTSAVSKDIMQTKIQIIVFSVTLGSKKLTANVLIRLINA